MENLIRMKIQIKMRLKKIANNIDIFGRGFELKKIDINNSFPDYVVNNQKFLKDWII